MAARRRRPRRRAERDRRGTASATCGSPQFLRGRQLGYPTDNQDDFTLGRRARPWSGDRAAGELPLVTGEGVSSGTGHGRTLLEAARLTPALGAGRPAATDGRWAQVRSRWRLACRGGPGRAGRGHGRRPGPAARGRQPSSGAGRRSFSPSTRPAPRACPSSATTQCPSPQASPTSRCSKTTMPTTAPSEAGARTAGRMRPDGPVRSIRG